MWRTGSEGDGRQKLNALILRHFLAGYSGTERAIIQFMLRRSLAMVSILSLLALVPLPLSACTVLSGLGGPCCCPMLMPSGPMTETHAGNSDPAISCHCVQSGAPAPNALQSATEPAPALLATSFVSLAVPIRQASRASLSDALAVSQLGPPGGRAGLCVYLI
jgi:hypothetical protein